MRFYLGTDATVPSRCPMSPKSPDTAQISPESREIGSEVPRVRGNDGRPLDGCRASIVPFDRARHWWGTWRRDGDGLVVELRCRRCFAIHRIERPV